MIFKNIFHKKTPIDPLKVAGHVVKVEVRKQSKSLRLRIDPLTGTPILSAPPYATNRQITSFLKSSEAWVEKNTQPLHQEPLPQSALTVDGISFKIQRNTTHKRAQVDRNTHILHLPDTLKHPEKSLQALLKPLANQKLLAISQELAGQLGVAFKDLEVREYKARWGSCSHDGRLSYSWRLILAPPEVLRYVCAHEVSHLVHMDHSPQFWATVARLDPSYKRHRQWLKCNGNTLFTHLQ